MCKTMNIVEVKNIMSVLGHGQHWMSGPQTNMKAMEVAEEHLFFLAL